MRVKLCKRFVFLIIEVKTGDGYIPRCPKLRKLRLKLSPKKDKLFSPPHEQSLTEKKRKEKLEINLWHPEGSMYSEEVYGVTSKHLGAGHL